MKHRKPAPTWHRLGLKISKKVVVGITAAATAFGGLAIASTAAQASTDRDSYADTVENTTFEQARKHYGLAQQMSEGATLHAWEWSFKTIEENIPAIAEAGYTSVQTEPISAIHNGGKGMIFTENWYYVYQPTDTTIGNWVMGTEDDLKSLCNTAHKYGVRIIVDVVANHMTATWGAIADRWKKSEYYHHDCNDGDVQDWNNRYQVTHCKLLGLYDINTENTETANMMHDFLVQAVNDGVDGFRFDAAKHIELPDEYNGSQYWNIILNNGAQFQYGEVLQDSISRDSDYAKLFSSHSKNGGGVTASSYGSKLRGALNSKNLNAGTLSDWSNSASPSNLVSWVESHDNYSNSDRESTGMSEWQMTMGWGVIGSRSQTMPLYFDRPVGSGGDQPQFAEKSKLGDAGSPSWKDPQVVAVNHFRNTMNNNKAAEYMRNCGANSCLMVERYIKDGNSKNDGVTITNMGDTQNLAGTTTTLDDGSYTDQVSGGKITVSGGKITSGSAPAGKISVFFTDNSASVSASGSKSFKTNTTTVTLNASNATNTTYTTSEGKSGSYKDGDTITVGASTAVGGTVTVKVQGKDADGQTVSGEFTCTKKDPNATSTAYAKKPNAWSNLYAYVYVDDPDATTLQENAKWPGEPMTKVAASDTCGQDGEYKYEIPDDLVGDNARIIFNDGNATNTKKYPADTTDGEDAAGLSIDGNYAWNGNTSSGTWEARNCVVTPVTSVKINEGNYTTDISDGVTTKQLTATTDPAGVAVSWKSSDTSVATVASDGTVTPVSAGTATITAKAGDKSASIKVTVTGQPPLDPVKTNTIYATKPSSWDKVYAYVYTGDGATAASNAKWPGVEMTATTATDGCKQSGYKYEVPDSLAKDAKVIFTDGGSQQYPGSRQPGLDYAGGTVSWDGSSTALTAIKCETPVPVSSVSISGDGVSNGKLSLKAGASAQLTATVLPENATDRKVTWTSSDSSVANVMGTGVVTAGNKAGTATIKATAGGQTASIQVTVEAVGKQPMTVYFKPSKTVKQVTAYWRVYTSPNATGNAKMVQACDGWWKVTVPDTKGAQTGLAFTDGSAWYNNGGNLFKAKGGVVSVDVDKVAFKAPDCTVPQPAKTMTVWYKPSKTVKQVTAYWRVYTSPNATGNAKMVQACDGWWKVTVPDTKGAQTGLAFTSDGKSFDNNGGKLYRAKGDSIAVSGGQYIPDVTPNCTVGSAVVGVNSVTISGNGVANGKLSIMAGKSVQLNAAVLPENATNKTVSWTSSNSSVANVMGTGLLTAGKAGTATITATADGVSSKITVTVTSAPQPSGDIVIAGAESGKVVGNEEFQLTAREKDGSSFENVEWSIPNTDLLKFINGGFSKTSTGRTVNLKAEFSFMRDDYADTVVSVKATRADGTVLTAQKKLSVGGYDSWSNSDPVDSITPSADGLVKTGDNEYTLTMSAGSSKHVDLKVLPSNARQLPLWSKLGGDDSVVTVDGDGTIYAHTAGTFQTGATIYNRYFNLTVVVK